MSNQRPSHELSPITMGFIDGVVVPNDLTVSTQECFKAKILRTAFDFPPTKIPEDFEAINYIGYKCPFVAENGKECTFADPMISLKHRVGLVAIVSSNSCELESASPRNFKKASLGGISIRAIRLGRHLNAFVRQKFTG